MRRQPRSDTQLVVEPQQGVEDELARPLGDFVRADSRVEVVGRVHDRDDDTSDPAAPARRRPPSTPRS